MRGIFIVLFGPGILQHQHAVIENGVVFAAAKVSEGRSYIFIVDVGSHC